jgi:FkbM family methyltransferase
MAILFFKIIYPGSRIIAFEPNPFAFQLLEKNISINRIKNVVLYNEALSTTEGTVSFFMNEDKGTLIGSLIRERGGNRSFAVKTKKLSDVVAEINPDLVKMDVEGAEYEIIEDLQKAGKLSMASQYIIEYHHQIDEQKPRLAGFLKKFESEEFSYNLKTDFGTAGRFQDIIISFTR